MSIGRAGSAKELSAIFFVTGKTSSSFFLLDDFDLRSRRFVVEDWSEGDSESSRSSTLPNCVSTVFCFLQVPSVNI